MVEIKNIDQSNVPNAKIIGPKIAAIMVVTIAEMHKYSKQRIIINIPIPICFR